jgi:hypothetical protein
MFWKYIQKKNPIWVPVLENDSGNSTESISDLWLGGSGSIIEKSTIKTDVLLLNYQDQETLFLPVDATDVIATLSGSGDINLKGKATNYGKLSIRET